MLRMFATIIIIIVNVIVSIITLPIEGQGEFFFFLREKKFSRIKKSLF